MLDKDDLQLEILDRKNFNEWIALFPPSENDPEALLKHCKLIEAERESGRTFHFLIKNREREVVGSLGIFNITRGYFQTGLLDYEVSEGYRKKGVATKAIMLLEKFCFNDLGLMKIAAFVDEKNLPSLNLLQKLNYKFSHKDECAFFSRDGKISSALVYYKLNPALIES